MSRITKEQLMANPVYRGCVRKKKYATRELAMSVAASQGAMKKRGFLKLTSYECRHCGSWHLTHARRR